MSSSFMMVAPSFEIVTFPCMHHQTMGQQHQCIHHSEGQVQEECWRLAAEKEISTYPIIVDELVHSSGSQSGPHCVNNSHACIYVADQLRCPLARVCALPEQDDLGLLHMHTWYE